MKEFDEDAEPRMASPDIDTSTGDVTPVSTGELPDIGPVLVQIVSDAVDTRWTATRYSIAAEALLVVPYQPGRRRVIVRNLGPNTVYLGKDYGTDSKYGFPLPSGQREEWEHESEMWAVCVSGETADIGVSLDYEVR